MAYEKQTWPTGEVITQEKLNHMEDGIANAGGGDGVRIVAINQTGPDTINIPYADFEQLYSDWINGKVLISLPGTGFVSYFGRNESMGGITYDLCAIGTVPTFDDNPISLNYSRLYVEPSKSTLETRTVTIS